MLLSAHYASLMTLPNSDLRRDLGTKHVHASCNKNLHAELLVMTCDI